MTKLTPAMVRLLADCEQSPTGSGQRGMAVMALRRMGLITLDTQFLWVISPAGREALRAHREAR